VKRQCPGRPVVFGEVLFDIFPGGESVLGGAPFNVAWNLQGLGLEPLFISRVGNDELGERVLGSMRDWGMDTRGVQLDRTHPTGTVGIELDGAEPTYTIHPNQAYDHIDPTAAIDALGDERPALLYHGSLALRQPVSRGALSRLLEPGDDGLSMRERCFVDINLRSPWWHRAHVLDDLRRARWAKLNADELRGLVGTEKFDIDDNKLRLAAQVFARDTTQDLLVVTRGAEGAWLFASDGAELSRAAASVHPLVDTVGAGDAFSAVMVLGLLRGWSAERLLERATELAAFVCELRGATSTERAHYLRFVES
jgi:fructokinase